MAMAHESPVETFKRAVAHAARSLAEQPDLEVVFSGDGPSLVGRRAVLPHPPRELSGPETTRIRGLADQMALRVAHHDDAIHARAKPGSLQGALVYDALEQAR
ncbi:MAG: cobaltochelatase subunit CobT, partial [Caulobacteraceae bacterium]